MQKTTIAMIAAVFAGHAHARDQGGELGVLGCAIAIGVSQFQLGGTAD